MSVMDVVELVSAMEENSACSAAAAVVAGLLQALLKRLKFKPNSP